MLAQRIVRQHQVARNGLTGDLLVRALVLFALKVVANVGFPCCAVRYECDSGSDKGSYMNPAWLIVEDGRIEPNYGANSDQ